MYLSRIITSAGNISLYLDTQLEEYFTLEYRPDSGLGKPVYFKARHQAEDYMEDRFPWGTIGKPDPENDQ